MSARDLCRLSGLARASLYRQGKPDREPVGELRQAIVQAALDHPAYGTRRTTQQVRRQKLLVNRKRVQRVMREENLLRRRRRTVPQTTDSKHSLRCYENLTREVQPTGPNKLWGSDLSYVRLGNHFVYVAVVLDVYSRRRGGLGRGSEPENRIAAGGAAPSVEQPASGAGLDSSFRSRFAVRCGSLCGHTAASGREDIDEPQRLPAGQRVRGKLFQDFEKRGSQLQRV